MAAQPHSVTSGVFSANRAHGRVAFSAKASAGRTRLGTTAEAGSLRVRFPNAENDDLLGVLVNTAGGVAGGDHFAVEISADDGARVTVTTAAAEKVYRSHGPDTVLRVRLDVAQGARLGWLPQETILFNDARVDRHIDIDLDLGSEIVAGEILVFGRTAMGEAVTRGRVRDRWRVRRNGRLVYAETVRLDNDIAAMLRRPVIGAGAVAIGTILIAPGDEALVERMLEVAASAGCEIGVSSWNGIALARFCAQDAAPLRAAFAAILAKIQRVSLPRIWS
jgi:urease accessory protein